MALVDVGAVALAGSSSEPVGLTFHGQTEGRYTLWYAAKMGDLGRIEELVGREETMGTFVDRVDEDTGWTALMYAANGGHTDVVEYLAKEACADLTLKDYAGKKLVLWFYPRACTGG